ncbi:MAG: AgmX/PglI C-terminal domain-containing protein [Candidatus Zhuqueibacterota bacterium]
MKDYNEENHSADFMQEDEVVPQYPQPEPGLADGLMLDRLPSEFRKSFFKTLDKRYILILLASFFFHIGAFQLLKEIFPYRTDATQITRIQERYAQLLLNVSDKAKPTPSTEGLSLRDKLDTGVITGMEQWMGALTENIMESIADLPDPGKTGQPEGVDEINAMTHEARETTRGAMNRMRQLSREELEAEMSSVGLLGLIAKKGTAVDYEYVEDLLEYANENSSHLSNVLSKLRRIEVPRYGRSTYLNKIARSSGGNDLSDLKRGRVSADAEVKQIVDNVQPLEEARTTPIARNVQFEDVSSSYLSKLAKADGEGKTRSAQDVLRVVESHKRALQDCYRQELKYNPEVRGKIVVRFVLNPEGIISAVSIVSSTLESPRMESCIVGRIRQWRNFPPCDPSIGDKTYRQSFTFGEK